MQWLNYDEAIFYGCVWAMGFLSSLFVLLGAPSDKSIIKCGMLAAISGFLAFSIISIFVGRVDEPLDRHWFYLGLASLIGLATKFQDRILASMLKKFGLVDSSDDMHDEGFAEDDDPQARA